MEKKTTKSIKKDKTSYIPYDKAVNIALMSILIITAIGLVKIAQMDTKLSNIECSIVYEIEDTSPNTDQVYEIEATKPNTDQEVEDICIDLGYDGGWIGGIGCSTFTCYIQIEEFGLKASHYNCIQENDGKLDLN